MSDPDAADSVPHSSSSAAAAAKSSSSKGGKTDGASSSSGGGGVDDSGSIRRNAKGGIYVAPGELHQAFEFFDVDGKGEATQASVAAARRGSMQRLTVPLLLPTATLPSGYITLQDLKKRLGVFYQNLSLREYKFLMNNKQELTEAELYALLANNELTNYDPVAEAFKVRDLSKRLQ